MIRLSNIQRIRMYFIIIAVIAIIIGLVLNIYSRLRASDVKVLVQTQGFSNALESYYGKFWRYPEAGGLDLRDYVIVSENGFANGSQHFYNDSISSRGPVLYQSDGENYEIRFKLWQLWPEIGIEDKKCVIRTGYVLTCASL